MDYKLSGHGTKEPVPDAEEIAAANPGLIARASAYIVEKRLQAASPGMLKLVFERDGQQPAEVSIEDATAVLYALGSMGERSLVGPPDLSEAGSWAMVNPQLQPTIPQPHSPQE
jgi:hypothetical protein